MHNMYFGVQIGRYIQPITTQWMKTDALSLWQNRPKHLLPCKTVTHIYFRENEQCRDRRFSKTINLPLIRNTSLARINRLINSLIDYSWFMKLFNTNNIEIVNYCQQEFCFSLSLQVSLWLIAPKIFMQNYRVVLSKDYL